MRKQESMYAILHKKRTRQLKKQYTSHKKEK
jgi:hypothetical protein